MDFPGLILRGNALIYGKKPETLTVIVWFTSNLYNFNSIPPQEERRCK